MDTDAIHTLIDHLSSGGPNQEQALSALCHAATTQDEVKAALLDAALRPTSPGDPLRRCLDSLGLQGLVETLTELDADDPDRRWRAANRIDLQAHPYARQALRRHASDPVARVRREVVRKLSASVAAMEELTPWLRDDDVYVRKIAVTALEEQLIDGNRHLLRNIAPHSLFSQLQAHLVPLLEEVLAQSDEEQEATQHLCRLLTLCDPNPSVAALQRRCLACPNGSSDLLCAVLADGQAADAATVAHLLLAATPTQLSDYLRTILESRLPCGVAALTQALDEAPPEAISRRALLVLASGQLGLPDTLKHATEIAQAALHKPQHEAYVCRALEAMVYPRPAAVLPPELPQLISTALGANSHVRRLAEVLAFALLDEQGLAQNVIAFAATANHSDGPSAGLAGIDRLTHLHEGQRLQAAALFALAHKGRLHASPDLDAFIARAQLDAIGWSPAVAICEALLQVGELRRETWQPHETCRVLVPLILSESGHPIDSGDLIPALRHPHAAIRLRALDALARLPYCTSADPLLLERSRDAAASIRNRAARLFAG